MDTPSAEDAENLASESEKHTGADAIRPQTDGVVCEVPQDVPEE